MAKSNLLFKYLASINDTKIDYLLKDGSEEQQNFRKEYSPYVINMGLSMFKDTVLLANMMNTCRGITPERHFLFLLHSVRKKRRFGNKWPKNTKPSKELQALSKFYEVSYIRAAEYMQTHTKEQIEDIVEAIDSSGGFE